MKSKPLRYVETYLFTTLLLYIVSYWETNKHGVVFTVVICAGYYFSMWLGYNSIKFPNVQPANTRNRTINKTEINVLIVASITTILISIVNVLTFYPSLDIIKEFITDPAGAYEYVKFIRRNELQNAGMITISSSLIGITLTTLGFTKYIVIVFLPLYWNSLPSRAKAISIASFFIYIVQAVLIGAMINIGVIMFSFFPILFLYSEENGVQSVGKRKKHAKVAVIAILLAGIALLYFMGTRFVSAEEGIEQVFSEGISGIIYYISHGYAGLSTCFDLPFVPTFGVTTFRGLATVLLPQGIYDSLWADSYLVRNQVYSGWQALQVWSTVFSWIASDVSFFLIPLVMILIGRFMARVWEECLYTMNPYAVLMMGQLMIFSFMIPANNQLFHTYGNAIGTIIIYVIYNYSFGRTRISFRF